VGAADAIARELDLTREVKPVVISMGNVCASGGYYIATAGQYSADLDVVDIHEGIESTLAILAHELRPLDIVRCFGSLPHVECHPQQINQVIMNLLLNASQATPGGGSITITTEAAADDVRVTVADTGSGIPAVNLARIFEPGFTTKDGRVGMGLGLLICNQIVDHHGGSISVESSPGAGASFTVTLPVRYRGAERRSTATEE
jgi:signal transduction histidine kinase